MSNNLTNAYRRVILSGPQKSVLNALCDLANDAGVSWPSHGFLAVQTGFSPSTVKRHLATLEVDLYVVQDGTDTATGTIRYRVRTPDEVTALGGSVETFEKKRAGRPRKGTEEPKTLGHSDEGFSETIGQGDRGFSKTLGHCDETLGHCDLQSINNHQDQKQKQASASACVIDRLTSAGVKIGMNRPGIVAALAEGVSAQSIIDTLIEGRERGATNPLAWAVATARGRHAEGPIPLT